MIVVIGATGAIGGALARRLAADGVPFRALVRRPDVSVPGAETVVADLDDRSSLPAAFDGATRLFLNAGGAVPVDGPQPMIAQQEAAIDAAVDTGVEHVVKISVLGVADGGPLAVGAHARIERHLAASGLAATVLRPSGFLQNLITGVAGFTADGALLDPYAGGAVGYIDAEDIAACAHAVLTGAAPGGGTHELTGPVALTHADLAAALSTVLGRPVGVSSPALDELEPTLVAQGLPPSFARDVAALATGVALGELAVVTPEVERLTGRPPRSAETFLAAHAAELRALLARP
ncbi:NmrA family NAD(P)-binding protein [Pseudonocardia endophytica]|uniref:Uncharacterized protein YbjT (DUF2867 family) n=1 Tax=Pseudonocardia endophytica TaxID=401976 RepID=A0A4R1HIQ4_PSEEN|nr:NmrA family NAD(P)-binding protein [Pseudonocardia endophytica]TCK22137.1 uncharacterized protein YbjT (DUF2867 family) [Pseudonocardia endophytica]